MSNAVLMKKQRELSTLLEGDALDYMLDFFEFLSENKLTASKANAGARWNITCKGKRIGHFKIRRPDYWFFSLALYKNFTNTENYETYITADQRQFLLDSFRTKLSCDNCKGSGKIEFLGNDYETYCGCTPI